MLYRRIYELYSKYSKCALEPFVIQYPDKLHVLHIFIFFNLEYFPTFYLVFHDTDFFFFKVFSHFSCRMSLILDIWECFLMIRFRFNIYNNTTQVMWLRPIITKLYRKSVTNLWLIFDILASLLI